MLRSPEILRAALDHRLKQLKTDMTNNEERLKLVKDNIYRCKREENWVITQAKKGKITEEQMDLQLKASMEERERYESELNDIWEAGEIRTNGEDIIRQAWESCQTLLPRLVSLRENQTIEATMEKQAIIQLLVDRIIVYSKSEITINLAIPEPTMIGVMSDASF